MGGGLSNAELIRTERSDGAIALILRRLATSIRKQDWFAVVIETLIVVMGVYLGIQLGNWNAARAQRAEGERLIERLYEEMTISLENEADCLTYMQDNLDRARGIFEELRTRQQGEGGEDAFRKRFLEIGAWTDLCPIRATLDQLQGGQIALVDDARLKDQILQFADYLDGSDTSIANLGSVYMSALGEVFTNVDFAWDDGSRRLLTSFDEAADNQALLRELETATFTIAMMLGYHEAFNAELHKMHRVLAEYLGEVERAGE